MEGTRLDVYMHKNGLSTSRENSKQLINNKCVFVNNKLAHKASLKVKGDESIKIINTFKYISRGSLKLEKAILSFNIGIENKICIDVGASTGGFTDYLIKNGADKVYAVDVGHDQLHDSLLRNEHVVNMEGVNFRYVDVSLFNAPIHIVSVDVSFISLELLFPKIYEVSDENTDIIALIKPQFEAGRENIGKNGIVKNKDVHLMVLNKIRKNCEENNLYINNITFSPIKGKDGNIEYLAHIKKSKPAINCAETNFKALVNSAFELLIK